MSQLMNQSWHRSCKCRSHSSCGAYVWPAP